jgi:hypothetical protein
MRLQLGPCRHPRSEVRLGVPEPGCGGLRFAQRRAYELKVANGYAQFSCQPPAGLQRRAAAAGCGYLERWAQC